MGPSSGRGSAGSAASSLLTGNVEAGGGRARSGLLVEVSSLEAVGRRASGTRWLLAGGWRLEAELMDLLNRVTLSKPHAEEVRPSASETEVPSHVT